MKTIDRIRKAGDGFLFQINLYDELQVDLDEREVLYFFNINL